jgi:hypothetical protein
LPFAIRMNDRFFILGLTMHSHHSILKVGYMYIITMEDDNKLDGNYLLGFNS